ncbi:hypothetical protein HJC23_002237 [Cyclotella cryptica]|uniref:HSF-type DNA-binding domain-containing protein n=1 Tax=Cyclotella cryptica TaxID=29204 RepID=A0ABD3QH40_9STRA|eukprot:CCRYP_005671-RA/>CCRYP_005671-RA protein AED:0.24 eAED:0.24 QI:0/-1/0/1/-1/1/1/0/356
MMVSPNSTKTDPTAWVAKRSIASEGDDESLGVTNEESLTEESFEQKNFAEKLFALLDVAEFQDVFHWLPSGDAFCVMDQSAFESKIMSKHFPSAKFQSFTRRMRRWGFHRVESTEQRSNGIIMFMCPRFRRGRPDLCKLMCDDRQIKKSKKADRVAGVDGFPIRMRNLSGGDIYGASEGFNESHTIPLPPRAWPSTIPTGGFRHWNPSTMKDPSYGYVTFLPGLEQTSAMDIFAHGGAHSFRCPVVGSTLHSAVPPAQITIAHNPVSPPNAFHHSIRPVFLPASNSIPRDLNGIRSAIDRLDAELAVVSRMKELKQRSLSLAAARASRTRQSFSLPGQGSQTTSSPCLASRRSWNA